MTSAAGFDDRYDDPDELRDQVRLLLRYRATIVLGVVLGLLGGLLLALLSSGSYTSAGEVLVRARSDPFSTIGVGADSQVSMGTERQIALSANVAARAATELRYEPGADALLADLRVTNLPDTQVLRFEYTAGTAQRAARVTNAFARAYLADRQDRSEAMAARMAAGLERQIAELTKQLDTKKGAPPVAGAAGLREQVGILRKKVSDVRTYDPFAGDIVRRAEPAARPAGPAPAGSSGRPARRSHPGCRARLAAIRPRTTGALGRRGPGGTARSRAGHPPGPRHRGRTAGGRPGGRQPRGGVPRPRPAAAGQRRPYVRGQAHDRGAAAAARCRSRRRESRRRPRRVR
ncbi:hypothetical protein WKI71_26525 [Streptomyces sp. MS1.AVA.1]|uniref:Polysaccharide chain length determinant N-terminal domain-containing protein n=1 Tax=Streptomyces machairae TaxID=3134109 RepID=A0ABU8UQP2_9ACTN